MADNSRATKSGQPMRPPTVFRLALRSPFATGVLEVADQFLLLRIDGDHRLSRASARLTAALM